MPKVSVILTSFNHAKYIQEAIDSVLNQTFTDFELIIWDDASSDDSWQLINQYSDPRIKAFHNEEQKRGIWGINKAISEIASGEYIAIHHSDDVWEPDKLEKQVAFLDTHSEIGAVFTNALAIAEDSLSLADDKHFYFNIFDQPNRTRHEWLRLFFSSGNVLCHPSVLIRKMCYQDCGLYRNGLAQAGDFDMWIRLCLKYEIHILSEKLVRFRVRENEANTSGNRPEVKIRWLYEFYKLLQNYREVASFDDLVMIFPSAGKYYRYEEADLDFVLAMVALDEKHATFIQLFGQDLLFEIISDPKRAANIKRLYDFDYKNFIALTAQFDVFSLQALSQHSEHISYLNDAIVKRDGQIANLNHAIVKRDGQIASLNQSMSVRDEQLGQLQQKLTKFDKQIANLNQEVAELDRQIISRDATIQEYLSSLSWRVTAPMRLVSTHMRRPFIKTANVKNKRRLSARTVNSAKIKKAFKLLFRGRFRELQLKMAFQLTKPEAYFPETHQASYSLKQLLEKDTLRDIKREKVRGLVDIVIPVYNGFDYLKPLFETLSKNTKSPYRLIVVDDGSTDARVLPLLDGYSGRFEKFLLLKNDKNKGFIGSVNYAVEFVTSDIFVLLNTDTELPPNWLDRLIEPILQDSKVASTTPFSNSATICSFPNFVEDNDLYLGLKADQIDEAFSDLSLLQKPITIPTGVGFCMAIRRLVVQKIGLFDPIFGRGYSEENDWCMRAAKSGYTHVLVNNLFVYHKHGGSFGSEEKAALSRTNHNLLLSRHPEYDQLVHEHINLDPAKMIRQYIKLKLFSRFMTEAVLFIDHNLGGGANHYRLELMEAYLKAGHPVLILVDDSRIESVYLDVFINDEHFTLALDEIDLLTNVFDSINITEVIYNNKVAASDALKTVDLITNLKDKLKFNLTMLFHDFYPICPSYTLINKNGRYCGVPKDIKQCEACLPKVSSRYSLFIPKNADINKWRVTWERMLKKSDSIICFSKNSQSIVKKAYPSISKKIKVVPHIINWAPSHKPRLDFNAPMHIGIVGGINYSKGLDVVLELVSLIQKRKENIKVTVIGEIDAVTPVQGLTVVGRYQKDDLPELIEKLGINIFLMPSVWPETYSYVTSELMLMDVPIACFDLGAPADRIREYELGKIIEMSNSETILNQLISFYSTLYEITCRQ